MIISQPDQESMDFDWFCVDADGHVGHLTTAGFKYLPQSVCSSAEDLQCVTDYFEGVASSRGGYEIDIDSIKRNRALGGEEAESKALSSFVAMAEKGLYSYDIETYLSPETAYFRVAIPLAPLMLNDLPEDIRNVIERTRLREICFAQCPAIAYTSTLQI